MAEKIGNGDPDSNPNPLHIILIPLMAQGHMIPMIDMARLLAGAGATVSFITTPVNATRIQSIIDRIEISHLPIRFVEIPFPCAESGLPIGCENIDLIPSPNLFKTFMESLPNFGQQFKHYLTTNPLLMPANCIIYDSFNSWVAPMATALGIPHIIFYGPSCFYILCCHLLKKHRVLDSIDDDHELLRVPELPQQVEVMKMHVARWMDRPGWEKVSDDFFMSEKSAHAVVMNTFEELESFGLEKFRKEIGKKVWPIGPLSLSDNDSESKTLRGKSSSIDIDLLQNWLDSKPPNSVMYVSFGSLARNSLPQLVEIGLGLDSANSSSLPFIWVVKAEEKSSETETWLSEFEKRAEGKGLLIRGWAPQAMILSHRAIGGFMTHCGWNSTLEAVSSGVVMATWPKFGDQFVNERLVVDVLETGVSVGSMIPVLFVDSMTDESVVRSEEVRNAVERVMDRGEEGEQRRRKARGLGENAMKTMDEGGSSFENLKEMIQFIKLERKLIE